MSRKYLHHTSDRDGEVREMHLAATDETTDGTAGRPLFEIRAREARARAPLVTPGDDLRRGGESGRRGLMREPPGKREGAGKGGRMIFAGGGGGSGGSGRRHSLSLPPSPLLSSCIE